MEKEITKKDIIDWIYSKNEYEERLEKYFCLTKQNYSMEQIYANLDPDSIAYNLNTDMKSIYPDYVQLEETFSFSEKDWIHPLMDVSIHKHPCFFPPFCHSHSFFELCYILKGHCSHTVYAENKPVTLELTSGDLLIIPPHLEHSITMNSVSNVINILIRKSTFESAFLNNLPSDSILYDFFSNELYSDKKHNYLMCHTYEDTELQNHFFNIAVEYCNDHLYANNIINQELAIFFSILLRKYSSSIEFSSVSPHCLELIPSILQYIEINYAHTNIQGIADHFGYNTAYLGRVFKLSTNKNLIEALLYVRISKAQELLLKSNQSVALIAEMVGYNDTTHFIRIFKKQTGLTPYQYRKQNA